MGNELEIRDGRFYGHFIFSCCIESASYPVRAQFAMLTRAGLDRKQPKDVK